MPGSPTKPPRKASATRKASDQDTSAPPTLNRAHLQGFVVGCVTGGLGCLGLFNALEADEPIADTPPVTPPALEVTVGPRFDFYTVLPNQELDLNPDIEPADLQSGNASSVQYLLQVGSFRQQTDADRRRGELALLGLEATVEPGDGENGRWYRVYVGPFEGRSEMARARSLTAQADMDTLLLKRESP
jgi:cell division septation protein DedD